MTNASYTKLFFPANLISPRSIYNLTRTKSNHNDSFQVIAEQEKALAQLPVNPDRSKRIQKAKEEIALDDWSTVDESMLDSEVQEKLLNEAKLLKQESKGTFNVGTSTVNGDSSHEGVQSGFEDNFTDSRTIETATDPAEDPHSSQSPIEQFTLQAPCSEDCSITFDEWSSKQQDLLCSKLHVGTSLLCWHNFEHNRCLKALSIGMLI